MTETHPDRLKTLGDEDLQVVVRTAMQTLLNRRTDVRDRFGLLRDLRFEIEQAMVRAPGSGDAVESLTFRARLASICDQEFARLESEITAASAHLPGIRKPSGVDRHD